MLIWRGVVGTLALFCFYGAISQTLFAPGGRHGVAVPLSHLHRKSALASRGLHSLGASFLGDDT